GDGEGGVERVVISSATAQWMLEHARVQLKRVPAPARVPVYTAPAEATLPRPRTLFLTIYPPANMESESQAPRDKKRRSVAVSIGRGPSLAAALDDAVSRLRGPGGASSQGANTSLFQTCRLKIDV